MLIYTYKEGSNPTEVYTDYNKFIDDLDYTDNTITYIITLDEVKTVNALHNLNMELYCIVDNYMIFYYSGDYYALNISGGTEYNGI